jgi:hypothetical protein
MEKDGVEEREEMETNTPNFTFLIVNFEEHIFLILKSSL